jgi:O-antigen/teichoic acid export membrane protein
LQEKAVDNFFLTKKHYFSIAESAYIRYDSSKILSNVAITVMAFLPKIFRYFLTHQNTRQILAKNTFWATIAEVLIRVLKFFFLLYAAKILGATEYGKLSFALSFVAFFGIFADLGLSVVMVKEFAQNKIHERSLPTLLYLKLFLSILSAIIVVATSFFTTNDSSIRTLLWILAFYLVFQSIKMIPNSIFVARQRLEYSSFFSVAEIVLLVGIGFFVLFTSPSVSAIGWSYVVSSFIVVILALMLVHVRWVPLHFSVQLPEWKKYLTLSIPLGLSGIFGSLFGYIDSITLGLFRQITQVGWYDVAYGLFNIILVPSLIVSQVFLPTLSNVYKTSIDKLQTAYNIYIEAMIFCAFGFLAGGLALAPRVVDFLYDSSYAPSIFALQFLLPAAVCIVNCFKLPEEDLLYNLYRSVNQCDS